MMLIKSFFRRIIKDFRHKELLPLKMIFFVQASTLYVLYPYLTIHMRELGINVEETAIMSAITPVIAMVMPPLAGMFADRVGNFKVLLSMFSSFGGAAALLLLLVPIGRITVEYPDRVIMDLSCPGSNELVYTMSQDSSCEDNLQPVVSSRIESCGYVCRLEARNSTEMKSILSSREYALQRYNLDTGMNSSLKFTIGQDEMPQEKEMDLREHRKLMNNPFFKTSIRQLSMNEYFFPSNQPFEFSCTISGFIEDNEMSILGNNTSNMIYENRTLCSFNPIIDQKSNSEEQVNYHSYKSKLKMDSNRRDRYLAESIAWNGKDYQKISCGNDGSEIEKVSLILPLFNYTLGLEPYRILNSEECSKRCIVTIPRKEICSNMNTVIEYNVRLTFWLYFAIRVFISVISGTTFAMFEGAVIAILREQKADYGLQRIYGSIGGMISSPLSGLLIDYASSGKGYTDFRPAFYSYAALKLISGLLMLAINLEFKSPATNVIDDVFTVLRNVEAAALFIACFVLGTAWGYIESFLFWLIQDLGGSRSLMGITITVGGIAGIPLLVLSGPIISKIGHANVLFIGFIFYAIRLCGYSMIYNPWHTLIFEALESVTLSLSFTAAVTYAAKLSTITTDSSIQGLLGGVYYGVGKGSGSLIGGYLMKAFGTRPTYRIFAVMTLITGIMYYIFNVAYLKKRPQVEGNDIVKKTPKNVENRKETGELKNVENGTVEFNLEEKKSNEQSNDLFGIENQGFTGERENPKSLKNNETRDQWESGEQKILENGIIDADSRKINDRDFSKERENLKSCKNDETKNQSVKDMEISDNDRNVDKSDKLIKLENKKSFGAKRLKKSQTDEDDRSENGENDRDRPDVTVLGKIVSEK